MTKTPTEFAAAFTPNAQILEAVSSERAEQLLQMSALLPSVLQQAIDGDEVAVKRAGRFICELANPHANDEI